MADFELGEQTGTQTGVSYEVIAGIMIGSTLVLMTGIGVYVLRVVQQSRATLDTLMDNISILKRATVRDRDDNDGPGMYGSSANQPARAIPEAPQLLRRFPVATFDGQETLMTKEDVERAVTDPVVQKVAQTHGHRFNLGGGGEIDSDAIMSLFDVRKHGVIPTRLFLWGLWVDDVSTAFTNARLMERETLLTLFPTVTPDNRESTEMSTEEVARALLMPEVQEIVARYGHRFSPQGIGAIDASKVMALFDQNNKGLIPTWMFLWGLGLDDPPKADALAPEPTWTALSQQPVELRLLDAFPVVSAGGREIELVKEDIDVQLQNHDVREMLAHSKHVFHPDEDGQITGATVMETLDFDQRGKITQRLLLKGLGVGGVSGLERVVSTREAEATIQDTSTLTEFLKGLHARGAATRAAERVASPGKSKKPKTPKAKKKEKVTPSAGTSVLPLSVMAAAAKAAAAAAEKVEKAKNVGKTGILVDADANELSEGASLTDVFHALDDDESGHLDRKELAEGLRDPHIQSIIHASGVDVEVLLDELDDDGSGMIDINEFLDGITNIGRALGITPAKPKERRSSHISVMDRIKEQHTAHDVAPVNDLVEMHNSKWKGAAKRINNLQFKSPEKRAQTNEQNFQTLFPAYNKLKAQSEDGLVHLADFEQACIDMPGLMTLSERSGMTVEQLFHRLDKDGSGDISVIEFVRGVEKLANELGFSPDDLDPKVAGANTPGQSAWRGAKGKLSAIAALGRGDGRTPLGSPPLDVSANLSGAVARQRSSFDSAGSPESAGSPIIGKEGGKHKSPRGFGSSGSPPAVNRPTRSSHFDGMHLFQALDVERDGSLTWDELDKGVHRPEMQKIIEDNGISVEHLAEKLDPNRTGEITLMMFIKGIGRLNKEAAQKKTGPLASLEEGRNEKTPSPAPTDSSFASTSEEEEEEDIDLESFASDDVNNREPNTSAPVLKTSAPPPAPTPAPTPPAPPPVPAPAIPTHATPAPAAEFDLSSFASTSDEEEDDDATLEPAPQRAPPAFAEIFTPSSVAEDMYGLNKAKVALLMGSPQFDALPVKVAHEVEAVLIAEGRVFTKDEVLTFSREIERVTNGAIAAGELSAPLAFDPASSLAALEAGLIQGIEDAAATEEDNFKEAAAREVQAATTIQAGFRGHKVRKQRKEQKAATTIQAGFKGYKARKKVKVAKQEKKAATTIQASFRGHKARKKVKVARKESQAATKIQAGFRGFKGRKRVQQEKIAQDYRTLYTIVDGVELNADGSVSRDELEQGLTLTAVARLMKRGKINLPNLLSELEAAGDGDIDVIRFLHTVGAFEPSLGLQQEETELRKRVRDLAHAVNRARRESQRWEEERMEQQMQERRALDRKAAEQAKAEAEQKRQEWLSSLEN